MANNKKYKGVYLDAKTNKYYVSTTFLTKDGVSIKKCKRGFETAKKAELWKLQKGMEISQQSVYTLDNERNEMSKIIDDYITYIKPTVKPTTAAHKKCVLRDSIASFFKTPRDITVKSITEFYNHIGSLEMKNSSKNIYISTIKAFVEYLELIELIDTSIAKKFKLIFKSLKVNDESVASFLEIDEFRAFINTFQPYELMDKVYFELLYFTGLRVSESLALRYDDIDIENKAILINKQIKYSYQLISTKGMQVYGNRVLIPYTKTNQNKTVVLPDWLLDELLSLRGVYGDYKGFIFAKVDGIQTPIRMKDVLEKHLKLAGLKHIRIHDFRHSHITMLYDMNVDGKYVAERLGHCSANTSHLVYEHITKNKRAKNDEIISMLKL